MAGKIHAAMVHFPIGLTITALVFQGLAALWRSEAFARAARYLVVAAALGGVLAVGTGFWALDQLGPSGALRVLAHRHRLFGILAAAFLLVFAGWILARGRRAPLRAALGYLLVLLIAAGLVAYVGDMGGDIVGWGG